MPSQQIPDIFGNRNAIVTGGTAGIGRAIAIELARSGCAVTAAGLPFSEFPQTHPKVQYVAVDVRSDEEVNKLASATPALDILVNAAGIIRRDAEFQVETFKDVVDVNLTGTMRMCTAFHRHLAASAGSIVNIASMLSYFGGPRVPAYTASRGGIAQLTRSLAVAWAADGIRVNAVAPGWIATDLTAALQADPERSAALMNRTPMGRWGTPEDVAGVVAFLCSPAAAFVTGAIIPVDGGYSAA